ncbi:polysaccharide pyruvyl transferase family protein [Thermodesulfobacteriota bacterium]
MKRSIRFFLCISLLDTNLSEREIKYLKKNEPIGCRDDHTAMNLKKLGIRSYLNGCTTLTLPKRPNNYDCKKVYCIDVYDEVFDFMPDSIKSRCENRTHIFRPMSHDNAMQYAENLLNEYRENASLIVTSRMHCAVPCVAMGIPTIFVNRSYSYRFSWLEDIIDVYTPDRYNLIDWSPKEIDCEKLKSAMKRIAVKRLLNSDADDDILQLDSIYAKRKKREYCIDALEWFKNQLAEHWDKNTQYRYAVWGVIQHSAVLIDYINKEYPKAKLVAIIDSYRQMTFRKFKTQKVETVKDIMNVQVLVAASAAGIYAKNYFNSIGKPENTYHIWSTKGILS